MGNNKVLVVGGSGFLGSYVADALSEAGLEVIIFDKRPSTQLKKGQKQIFGDLLDLEILAKAALDCNYVYNFAGLADLDDARDKPIDTVNLNVLGTVNALEAAKRAGVKRFVFASSIYVYSKSGSFYRASKQSAEKFVEAYYERYGLEYTILRYGSLYGRRADNRNGIYRLLRGALESGKIVYQGSSKAMREYIHVEDAARLTVKILEEQYKNRHIVLTGHEKMSIENLLHMLKEMIPGEISITYADEEIDGHYEITPYAFQPKIGHKLVANDYVDLGQGLLDCLAEIHQELNLKTNLSEENLLIT